MTLSDNEIRDQIVSMITAGYETTSAALAWAAYTLLTLPGRLGCRRRRGGSRAGRQAADRAGPPALTYLNGVVHETLRLYSPGSDLGSPGDARPAVRRAPHPGRGG